MRVAHIAGFCNMRRAPIIGLAKVVGTDPTTTTVRNLEGALMAGKTPVEKI